MDTIKLSPRLIAIAGLVDGGDRVVDVGTDHGFIPAWLVRNGISPRVYASDIVPGPLARARETARTYGLEDIIEFRLCDGLDACSDNDVDAVIIAGMGGEAIAGILERASWTRGKKLILQPMSKHETLRGWLYENGYKITGERLVRDAGIIYSIISAAGGSEEREPTDAELLAGKNALPRELYEEYVRIQIEKMSRAADSIRSGAARGEGLVRLEGMLSILEGLKKLLEE